MNKKSVKRWIASIMSTILVFSVVPVLTQAAPTADTKGASASAFPTSGELSGETEYQITTRAQLDYLAELSQTNNFAGIKIYLTADIDMGGESAGSFTGIGVDSTTGGFSGTFYGNGHTISNYYSTDGGFFNCIGSTDAVATIENIIFADAVLAADTAKTGLLVSKYYGGGNIIKSVNVSGANVTLGAQNCAIIAATNHTEYGTDKPICSVKISGCTVSDSTLSAQGNGKYYGIYVGFDSSNGKTTITDSSVVGCTVSAPSGTLGNSGGMVGQITGAGALTRCTVSNSFVTSGAASSTEIDYLGGIIGRFNGTAKMTGCVSESNTITANGAAQYCGGVAGGVATVTSTDCRSIGNTVALAYATTTQLGRSGLFVGYVENNAKFIRCTVEGGTISSLARAHSLGGFAGSLKADLSGTVYFTDCAVSNASVQYNSTNTNVGYNMGGFLGHAQSPAVIEGCTIDTVTLTATHPLQRIGGVVGLVSSGSNDGITITGCTITGTTYTNTFNDDSSPYQNGASAGNKEIGGIVGKIEVGSNDISFNQIIGFVSKTTSYFRYAGCVVGIVTSGEKTVNINGCYVKDSSITSKNNRANNDFGGILGYAASSTTVNITNCANINFKDRTNQNGARQGGIVGNNEGTLTVKNCYVSNLTLTSKNRIDTIVGTVSGTVTTENNYYDKWTNSATTHTAGHGATQIDAATLASVEFAYNLNTTNGAEANSHVWSTDGTTPVLAVGDRYPISPVTYVFADGSTKDVLTQGDGSTIPPTNTLGKTWFDLDNCFEREATVYENMDILKGDVDGNEETNIIDLVKLVKYINGTKKVVFSHASGDMDNNGQLDSVDTASVRSIIANDILSRSELINYKVMSYNIRCYQDGDEERYVKVMSLIESRQPDIVGLQEVNRLSTDELETFMNENGYAMYGYGRYGNAVDSTGFNNADNDDEATPVMWKTSRFSMEDSGHFWLSSTPDVAKSYFTASDNTKGYVRCLNWVILKDKVTNQEIFAASVHLDPNSQEIREMEATLIGQKLMELSGGRPMVLTGDFNTNQKNAVYKNITSKLVDTRFATADTDTIGTYTAYDRYDESTYSEGDFLFASNNVHVRTFRVLDDKSYGAGAHISDHLPIMSLVCFVKK